MKQMHDFFPLFKPRKKLPFRGSPKFKEASGDNRNVTIEEF